MATTSRHDLPFPLPSDLVKDGAAAIQALADAVDARLSGALVSADVGTEAVANNADDLLTLTVDDAETSGELFAQSGANTIEYVGSATVVAVMFAQVTWEADGTGSRRVRFLKNGTARGTTRLTPDAAAFTMLASWPVILSTGDELQLEVWQDSGVALDVTAALYRCVVQGVAPA